MSVSDVFGDCLARIKNGQMARLPQVSVIFSKMVVSFCEIMVAEGYIGSFFIAEDGRSVVVVLKYTPSGGPVIRELSRVSRLGCRVYVSSKKIRVLYRGLGIQILSTSRGVMQSYVAREMKIGGEVLCSVF